MKVLMIEPLRPPELREINDSLEDMQEIVGGTIQAIYPFDDTVAIVCHDMGKLLEQPMNRALRDEDGQIYDIICGNFFLCGLGEENFASLTEEQVERYTQMFAVPEVFLHIGDRIMVLQAPDYEDMEGGQGHES